MLGIEVVATAATTKLEPFRKKSRRAELVVSVIKDGKGVMMCVSVMDIQQNNVESFVCSSTSCSKNERKE
jgi:hypothetical protein